MTKDIWDRFSDLGIATIYEASGRQGLINLPLIQLIPGSRAAGPARTVLCGQDDNRAVHAVIEQILPHEILVLSMPEPSPVALIGELLAIQIQMRTAAGVLVDAAVRDVDQLIQMGLPVWTRFIRVRGASKTRAGRLNLPVAVGDTTISPGDGLVMDGDGAVCIRQARLQEVLLASEARQERENHLKEKLLAGEMTYDLHGLRGTVERSTGNEYGTL